MQVKQYIKQLILDTGGRTYAKYLQDILSHRKYNQNLSHPSNQIAEEIVAKRGQTFRIYFFLPFAERVLGFHYKYDKNFTN